MLPIIGNVILALSSKKDSKAWSMYYAVSKQVFLIPVPISKSKLGFRWI